MAETRRAQRRSSIKHAPGSTWSLVKAPCFCRAAFSVSSTTTMTQTHTSPITRLQKSHVDLIICFTGQRSKVNKQQQKAHCHGTSAPSQARWDYYNDGFLPLQGSDSRVTGDKTRPSVVLLGPAQSGQMEVFSCSNHQNRP